MCLNKTPHPTICYINYDDISSLTILEFVFMHHSSIDSHTNAWGVTHSCNVLHHGGVTYMASFWGCSPHCKSIAMPSQSIGLAQCCLAIDQGRARGLMFFCTCRGHACDRKRCSRMPSRKKEMNMSVIIIVSIIIIIIAIITARSIIIPLALQIAHSSCSPPLPPSYL